MPSELSFVPQFEPSDTASNAKHVLVFFIPGNPGLIDYYEPFLSTLYTLLNEPPRGSWGSPVYVQVYGRNLAGFDDAEHEPFDKKNPPYDLEYQIRYTINSLAALRVHAEGPQKGTPFDMTILVGHSIGAFIALEIFHRLLQSNNKFFSANASDLTTTGHFEETTVVNPHPTAGILLFPAITHLAHSPSGRWLELVRTTPALDTAAQIVVRFLPTILNYFVSDRFLHWLLRLRGVSEPEHAAATTCRLLRSRDGLWQVLHLGKDEMRVVVGDGSERWADELWQVAETESPKTRPEARNADVEDVPKFFIYFKKHDHWVADEWRDRFIEKRNEHARRKGPRHKRGRTRIILDSDNIPHAFCIKRSETMAEKVRVWINEIVVANF